MLPNNCSNSILPFVSSVTEAEKLVLNTFTDLTVKVYLEDSFKPPTNKLAFCMYPGSFNSDDVIFFDVPSCLQMAVNVCFEPPSNPDNQTRLMDTAVTRHSSFCITGESGGPGN